MGTKKQAENIAMASGASGELNKIITRWKTLNFTDQLYVWSIYVWPTYMYGSVVMDIRPVTQRFQVQAPLWSLDTVGHALRKSTLSKKNSVKFQLKWVSAYAEGLLYFNWVVSHPGGFNDSHLPSNTETRERYQLKMSHGMVKNRTYNIYYHKLHV